MSRPKKSIDQLKIIQINIRVTLEEQIHLEQSAKIYGLTLVGYIRRRILNQQLPKHTMPGVNRELLIELSRVGNNINQLTKKANQNNPNLIGLRTELDCLYEVLNQIKQKLLR